MTNREWYFNKLNEMTDKEFVEELSFMNNLWSAELGCADCVHPDECITCGENWLKKKHSEPMPELKPGMFVKVNNSFETRLGIIIENPYEEGLAVNYKNDEGWDRISDLTVKAIYKTVMYSGCTKDSAIWMEEEEE